MDQPSRQSLPPIPLALLVCDWAHRDPGNGKWTLLGLFSVIATREIPFTHPVFFVYFAFTDAKSKVPLKIRLVDVNEDRAPLIELLADIDSTDPLAVNEVVAPIPVAVFLEYGEYRLQVFTYDELLIERRIMVLDTRKEKPDEE
jgi:hypothetical protein